MPKCAYPECEKETGKYLMSWTNSRWEKEFGLVCAQHDKILGRKHLMETGMTLKEAITWEKEESIGKD